MGDFIFKISGTAEPFLVRLFNAACTSVVEYKHIEYSGTSVCFGNLAGSTCYNVSVTDRIGGIIWSGITTPTAHVAPELPQRQLNIYGTPTTVSPYNCVSLNNAICTTPALNQNESICFDASVTTYNNNNSMNQIIFYCKANGTSSFTMLSPQHLNEGISSVKHRICLNYNDCVCFAMASICNAGATTSCGYARICLTGVTGTCVNASIGVDCVATSVSYSPTTTTTTTTLAPVTVYFAPQVITGSLGNLCSSTYLVTNRALVAGECFRICFTSKAFICKCEPVTHAMSSCAHMYTGVYNRNETCVAVPYDCIGCFEQSNYCYYDVNYLNINNLIFCNKIIMHTADTTSAHRVCSTSELITISNSQGANFQIGSCFCVGILHTCGGGGGFLIE